MKKLIPLLLSVLLLSSCSGNTAVTVGDIKITQSEVEFYLDSIKSQMSDTELQTDEDWQTKEIEGKTRAAFQCQRYFQDRKEI